MSNLLRSRGKMEEWQIDIAYSTIIRILLDSLNKRTSILAKVFFLRENAVKNTVFMATLSSLVFEKRKV